MPEELYEVPIGQAALRRSGRDVTVAATSYMVIETLKAATELAATGIEVEVIDVRSLKPLDEETIFQSVRKTGRLIVADAAWLTCGFAAEIAARVVGQVFESLRAPIVRVTLPDTPAPTSAPLEKAYYPMAADIVTTVKKVCTWSR